MMSSLARADTSIARLEVHAVGVDPVAVRLRVERLLGLMELRPRALGRRAILCVRELRDPLPGALAVDRWLLRPPPAWEQAMQRELDRLVRAAAWPAHDAVPAASEAVVFGDEAELLACLGGDLVSGHLPARWWWSLLVPGTVDRTRAVGAAWLAAVEHAPAALQMLAERRQAEAFVGALARVDRLRLIAALEDRFALPRLVVASAAMGMTPSEIGTSALTSPAGARAAPPAPWAAWVDEAAMPALAADERALLGIALSLARSPAGARSADFASALAAWRAHETAVGDRWSPPSAPGKCERDARAHRWDAGPGDASASDAAPPMPLGSDATGVAVDERGSSAPALAPSLPSAPSASASDSSARAGAAAAPSPSGIDRIASDAVVADAELVAAPAPAANEPASIPPSSSSSDSSPAAESSVIRWSAPSTQNRRPLSWRPRTRAFGALTESQLGGVFYLANAALYLELYSDAENLALPFWDFVALIGRRLVGPGYDGDPIWALLAELSGRGADDPPGVGFHPPAEWSLSPAWLTPFPPSEAHATIISGRLRIQHAEGFVIVDQPIAADAALEAAVAAAFSLYGARLKPPVAGSLSTALDDDVGAAGVVAGAPLDLWIERTAGYLAARLRRALDVSSDGELFSTLLAHPACVHVSSTHVDIVLRLEALPVAIRFAGLDRDPGWIAAAGRFVAFHFE
ncbi:MAG TPA: hypothetical protein VGL59_21430 [Polyangia bacterium]